MPKHIQAIKTTIISFKNATLWARQIFHAYSLKPLDRSYGYALHGFHEYSLKNLTRAE